MSHSALTQHHPSANKTRTTNLHLWSCCWHWHISGWRNTVSTPVARVTNDFNLSLLLVYVIFIDNSSTGLRILHCGQEYCWVLHEWIQWYYICLVSGLCVMYSIKLSYNKNLWHNHSVFCFKFKIIWITYWIPFLWLQWTNRLWEDIYHAWWEINLLSFTLCITNNLRSINRTGQKTMNSGHMIFVSL